MNHSSAKDMYSTEAIRKKLRNRFPAIDVAVSVKRKYVSVIVTLKIAKIILLKRKVSSFSSKASLFLNVLNHLLTINLLNQYVIKEVIRNYQTT